MGQDLAEQRAPIVGTWKLISFERVTDQGEVVYPFGADARGSITYTAAGRYAVHIMRGGRPPIAAGDRMRGTAEEIKAIFEGCIAYYGWYDFEPEAGFVVHYVEASLYPNWEGQGLKRFCELAGDRLTLTTVPSVGGGDGNFAGKLVWERV